MMFDQWLVTYGKQDKVTFDENLMCGFICVLGVRNKC